ncbi:MAG: DUF4389 domain-containing protein, partial [Spirochaetia bacterium]|nr:DUF4389 domain-containing protein [Spirochaetia bacterium]
DESITIDVDSLDIDAEPADESNPADEDESITIDIDSLDIDGPDEFEHIAADEDDEEKLTLDDAGLTMDDLTGNDENYFPDLVDAEQEYDEHLNIDEVYPQLEAGLDDELREAEDILSEESDFVKKPVYSYGPGSVTFSIDYSLKYSRLRALFRLLVPLFVIRMLPHFIVLTLYGVLSLILGGINNIVTLISGRAEKDFMGIIEKTLRYFVSIQTSFFGIVDEYPVFTGRKDINHSLQVDIDYPEKSSRILAAFRVSLAGILIAALPHLIICALMNCLLPVMYLMGILCIIVTGKLPYSLFDIISRIFRYSAGLLAFITGVVDKYPVFKF